ncbi:MAG: tetratricopeptide repeat protein [Bacteroidales bacterium]
MRRTVLFAVGVAVVATAAAFFYAALAREADYRRLIREGEAALAADQTFPAVEAFSGAIVLKPNSMLAYLRRGETYRRRGEYQAALRDLRRAGQLDPAAPQPLEESGDVNVALEKYARAAESYDAYLRLDDRSPSVFYKLALVRVRQDDPARAIPALRRALALNAKFAEALYVLGMCQGQLGNYGDAVTSLEQAVRLAPALLPAREELVRVLLTLQRDTDAIAQLEALAALEPQRPDHLIEAALVYARLGRTDLAVAELNRALERDPQPRVYLALGRIWLEAAEARREPGSLSKAFEALDRGVRGPGATSEGLTLYGRALLMQGDLTAADEAFSQAVEKSPVDPEAYRSISALAERRGQIVPARDALIRYVALAPDGAAAQAAFERIGELSLKAGRQADGVAWFRRASDAAAGDADTLARIARLQLQAGDSEGATVSVDRGLQRVPAHVALLALRRQLATTR